jgi:hypothetical protein
MKRRRCDVHKPRLLSRGLFFWQAQVALPKSDDLAGGKQRQMVDDLHA